MNSVVKKANLRKVNCWSIKLAQAIKDSEKSFFEVNDRRNSSPVKQQTIIASRFISHRKFIEDII